MRFSTKNSLLTRKSLPLFSSVVISFLGWIIYMVSLAVTQSKVSDLFVSGGSRVFSLSWWAFAYQTFLFFIVVFFPKISIYFSETLFSILTIYSVFLFTIVLNSYTFFTQSYLRGLLVGAFIIIIVDFYWIFYFSTVPHSSLYFFPERPNADRYSEAKYSHESSEFPTSTADHPLNAPGNNVADTPTHHVNSTTPVGPATPVGPTTPVGPATTTLGSAAPVAPAAHVAPVDHRTVVPPGQHTSTITETV